MTVHIKICCVASIDEARMAAAAGANALGLVAAMPSGPGPIDEDLIGEIAAAVRAQSAAWSAQGSAPGSVPGSAPGTAPHPAPPVQTFMLTPKLRAHDIIAQHQRCQTSTLQLVDAVPHDELRRLREALPTVQLVQVIHVTGASSIDEALAVAPLVDALLLDSGNPRAAVKELGGTGRTHNWGVSRQIVAASPVPVYLAGGLSPDNVAEAIARVRPFGVDVCSGLRSQGRLDAVKLQAYVRAVRGTVVVSNLQTGLQPNGHPNRHRDHPHNAPQNPQHRLENL